MARPPQPVTATVAPKAAEAVTPQARTDLPETKTVAPLVEGTAVRHDKKRVREDDRDKDRQRKQSSPEQDSEADEHASLSDQAASAFINAATKGYVSSGASTQKRSSASMRAYHEKLAGEKKPVQHRVEKLA